MDQIIVELNIYFNQGYNVLFWDTFNPDELIRI